MAAESLMRKLGGAAHALAGDTLAFYEECERTGGLVRTHVWGLPYFVVTDPEIIQQIFISKQACFVKPAGLRANRRAFGLGLLTSDGELWRQQRAILQPAFRPSHLEAYWPWVQAALERVLGSWGESGVRDIQADMTDLCFDVLGVPLFGEDLAALHPRVTEATAALHAFHDGFSKWAILAGVLAVGMRGISTRLGRPDFVFDPSRLPTAFARRLCAAMDELDKFVYDFIDRRRAEPPREDMISVLLFARNQSGAPLSRQQIRDEVVTMFFAGHETGAAAISWTLFLLAGHPEVARSLAAEPEGGALNQQVIHEALRLFPPVYRVGRTAIKSCRLGFEDVPAGAEITIPQWAVQRSPRYFDEPLAFRPERWTPEFMKQLPKFAYFPFGGGPRVCIGNLFGFHESMQVAREINRRYELRLAPGTKAVPQQGITLMPPEGALRLEYQRRH
jgi:cytochrome P450